MAMTDTLTVSVTEAHNRLSELIGLVRQGHTVTIAKRDVPVARIVPTDDVEPSSGTKGADLLAIIDEIRARRPDSTAEESLRELEASRASWERPWYQ